MRRVNEDTHHHETALTRDLARSVDKRCVTVMERAHRWDQNHRPGNDPYNPANGSDLTQNFHSATGLSECGEKASPAQEAAHLTRASVRRRKVCYKRHTPAYSRYFMKTALHRNRLGFTLVEIMIVVTIISIIASIAIPAYGRSRKRAQATRTLEELRMLEYALDRWAIEQNKSVGDAAALSDLVPYLKNGSTLSGGVDILGNTYGDAFSVDYIPKVNDLTFEALSDVAPAAFWSPYK